MKKIDGGVCAPKGFQASGIHCGIRLNKEKKDLALIVSDCPSTVAGVYTQNKVKGAPIIVSKKHIEQGNCQAIICNSGNANTCNADGEEKASEMCELIAEKLNLSPNQVVVASTGVIGKQLDITPIQSHLQELVDSLGYGKANSFDAANAIMTTDLQAKQVAYEFDLNGKKITIGGIGKGSGMIHPNMATMLIFISTDAVIDQNALQKCLSKDVEDSFNMISVDGDTSTNDMVCVLANGKAENANIVENTAEYTAFSDALNAVTTSLCKAIAKDGEGASKLLTCIVEGAKTKKDARTVAKSVITSSLFKAAMFGADANWGRVLCAIGYAQADVDINKVDVSFRSKVGEIQVCKSGSGVEFSEEIAKKILQQDEIEILINLNDGLGKATAWGCDLTYDYVKINGDYRS